MHTLCFNREYCPFHRPILKLRASHCSRTYNTHTHIYIFPFVFCRYFLFHLGHHNREEKKRHSHTHPFSNQLNVTGGCIRQNRAATATARKEEKKLTNISAFFYRLDVIHFVFVVCVFFFIFIFFPHSVFVSVKIL